MAFNPETWINIISNISLRYFLLASVSFVIFYILFRRTFAGIKIQAAFPKNRDYLREILYSMSSMAIFATMAYLVVRVLKPVNNMIYGNYGTLSWWRHALSFIWMFFLHDAYFYWIHRLMHLPWLFRHVHLVHHTSTNPSPWTAYAFHPLEALLEAGIIPLIAFSFPVHIRDFSFFMLFQIIYNIYGHLGYELYSRFMLNSALGKWINTGLAHNQHHKYFKGNYGLYTLIWDRVLGTLRKDYDKAVSHFGQKS